ncbi:similar to serine/threonine protein kinase [Botrytis cinerea T4]|uniref:non-specific serine/threonine protein kinase n=1 Tax=Botryotinia fuckeliana (strain T4) TaxID=999810 RepID=G2YC92_BOTF4|nr:similar to serine/threonine protein kinase [Botrytis cinerea T4]
MASYNVPATAPRSAAYGGPVPIPDPSAPPGTFAPGTKIQVGSHKVVIQKYFSEGGFAHVYLVKMPKPIDGTDIAVLKRVAVPDKEHLANMRTEVETMKKLKGHRPIVTYYDSHASQLKGGGYEVFLLMEFCNGGGLIDFMNTRLQNRLTEPEILKIFSDVAEGVACMHYLKPPLLHRDLKVENVLITSTGPSRRFKLCDFGSTAPPRPAATTAAECRLIEDDVQKHTTLQYRSPEMIDVYRKLPIDEKSDIWALGVLLYKLCYYTTPFEAQGQLAILNASFKFPSYPMFSDPLKNLIASMLKEKPTSRPNIYQVLRESCLMQGIEVPIKDIYAGRTQSESRQYQQLPATDSPTSPPVVGAVFAPPTQHQTVIPDVVPMRRGRPTANTQPQATKPSPSPMRGTVSDPFAALDSTTSPPAVDEISNRFPSLDQFSLLHEGGKFDFGSTSPTKTSQPVSKRVTERLADDAFAMSNRPGSSTSTNKPSRAQQILSSNPLELQTSDVPATLIYQPTPTHPGVKPSSYVSQGTMTTPTPPPSNTRPPNFTASPRLLPSDHHRSTSLPRNQIATPSRTPTLEPQEFLPVHPGLPRTSSYNPQSTHSKHSSSSRPSLEMSRPSNEALESTIPRTKSSLSRSRPSSQYLESNMDFLREKEGRPSIDSQRSPSYSRDSAVTDSLDDDPQSNVDFLKSMEDHERVKKDRRRSSGSKSKRSSMPTISLSGTKNLLAGKFGDAFKRFENNASAPPGPRTPSPLHDLDRRDLTPIAGSEATDDRSDDGTVDDNMTPEQRRENERRRLSIEEKRVSDAAAEYRKRLADRGGAPAPKSIGGVTRAASIQHKVKSLLDENSQQPSPKKTAEGYGRYTDIPGQPNPLPTGNPYGKPSAIRKPVQPSIPSPDLNYTKPRPQQTPSQLPNTKTGPRPSAPPKPTHLNNMNTGGSLAVNNSPPKQSYLASRGASGIQPRSDMTSLEKEEYLADFSKRFPSLSSIEMVEREIERDGEQNTGLGMGIGRRDDRPRVTKEL